QHKIREHSLEMKLVNVEYTFDRNKIIFYFTSEERVDFRELVKDLASIFKTRIELRQIGVRDEAKIKGGIGPCGRAFCCTTFLEEFEPVSIRMAKGQNLSLNPTKISGVCGRLMCCLRYEASAYEDSRGDMPKQGDTVITPDGEGTVRECNFKKKTVTVKLQESGHLREFPLEEVDQT
ncbi:MAG: PSP1 domain-containing protein, partial [Dethiobacteria bacterium]